MYSKIDLYINRLVDDSTPDMPMWNIENELEYFNSLCLTEEERERILYKNACELFKIKL